METILYPPLNKMAAIEFEHYIEPFDIVIKNTMNNPKVWNILARVRVLRGVSALQGANIPPIG